MLQCSSEYRIPNAEYMNTLLQYWPPSNIPVQLAAISHPASTFKGSLTASTTLTAMLQHPSLLFPTSVTLNTLCFYIFLVYHGVILMPSSHVSRITKLLILTKNKHAETLKAIRKCHEYFRTYS